MYSWIALAIIAATTVACGKSSSPTAPATTEAQAAEKFEIYVWRTDSNQVLVEARCNALIAIKKEDRARMSPDDTPESLIIREWSRAIGDPDPRTAFKDWYTQYGNGNTGHLDWPVTVWGPITVKGDRFEFQFLMDTFKLPASDLLEFDNEQFQDRFNVYPTNAAHISRASAFPLIRVVAGSVSALPTTRPERTQ